MAIAAGAPRLPPVAAGRASPAAARAANPNAVGPPTHPSLPAEASTSPRVLNLNGNDWRFQLFDRPEAVPAGFGGATFDASSWPQVSGMAEL